MLSISRSFRDLLVKVHNEPHLCIKCQLTAGPISKIPCETHRKRNVLANREYRARVPRPGGPMIICTECQNPAEQGKRLCGLHLRRARAAAKRFQTAWRLFQAQALAMPKVAGLARLLADGDEQTSPANI